MVERKLGVGATISAPELEKIPSARDPWAMLTQTPGVRSDRINVGGNEGGQQAVFTTAGANTDDTTWAVDGVNITDMSAIASPQYYDFEAFEELQFTNGGSDVSLESSGVTVNIVTRRGTNEWRGSGGCRPDSSATGEQGQTDSHRASRRGRTLLFDHFV